MSSSKSAQTKTKIAPVASKLAVMSYLDDMLHEATTAPEADLEEVVEVAEPETIAAAETDVQVEDTVVSETETREEVLTEVTPAELAVEVEPVVEEIVVETSVVEEPVLKEPIVVEQAKIEPEVKLAEPDVEDVATSSTQTETETESGTPVWQANGRPTWAQERFDCLVFSVNGLKLAVPLLLLGNIHQLDREMTPLFDQPSWFLGLLPIQSDRNIRVVDTAQLVMPERYNPDLVDQLKYAVGVHDSDWAFGAHAIDGSITLMPDDVKWRSLRTSRPWLAGTVISEMCALVDLDAFSKILRG